MSSTKSRSNSKLILKKLFKSSFLDFKKSFYLNFKYEIIYKIISLFIILPLISIITNCCIHISGKRIFANYQLLKFSTSIPGIITTFILIILSSILFILEIGGLVNISEYTYWNKEINVFEGFYESFKAFPKILNIGLLKILIYISIVVPFLLLVTSTYFLNHLYMYDFILNNLFEFPLIILLLGTVMIIVYVLLIPWVFAIHICIIENKNFSKALKRSKELCKNNFLIIYKTVVSFHILILFGFFILGSLITLIIFLLIKKFNFSPFTSLTILSFYSIIESIILFTASLITTPFNVILITRLYYFISKNTIGKESSSSKVKNFKQSNYKKIFYIIISLVIIFFSILSSLLISYSKIRKKDVLITAHRGSGYHAPENTISGLQYAMAIGADYAEIDVQETKDGKVILLHDNNLKRVAGINKNICDINYDELKRYDVGKKFSRKFRGEEIPTLEEVLKYCKGSIKLNIELKMNSHNEDLPEKVIDIIHKEKFSRQCVITSISLKALEEVRQLDPHIKIGNIRYIVIDDMSPLDVDFYSVETKNVDEKFVNNAHLTGREVYVWTVNNENDMKNLIHLGVDNIITDHPEDLKTILNKIKKNSLNLKKTK